MVQDNWYQDAVIYEVHVKSFYDSNKDGIGDFKGLIHKLDYLVSLGINTIWLLPFYPSPLKDDGYDIADYFNINSSYGTINDFRLFLNKCHQKNMKVITELVINHTSIQHEWFQKSRTADSKSVWKDFYVWSQTPEKYKDARIIFKDFETSNWTWDPVAKAYYWHRFYSHQPDLNFNNLKVHKEIFKIVDFWFKIGVDGLRLDAIPYLYEKEGTNCENLPETHQFLKTLRSYIDKNYTDKMLLAEANQWPEDAVSYFGNGDECHMAFHFPVMPRLFMSLQMEDKFPIIDIFDQTPAIPENCQWVIFIRNHDELTLEMVTDEERDYMYKVYANDSKAKINLGIRRRLAPLLSNNRRKIELMNILLFSLPGTPVIYYGDEIGMGDNYYLGDRNGVRTPMQWNSNKNAGFSDANPQELYLPIIIEPEYHYEAVNVENQEKNLSSLLWWMKRMIGVRKKYKAFSRGSIEFINSNNFKILSFIRKYEHEIILVIINLSRFSQFVKLELSKYEGYIPEEIFSKNRFPLIKKELYNLSLGFHNYFWFSLKKEGAHQSLSELNVEIELNHDLKNIINNKLIFYEMLINYLNKSKWFKHSVNNIEIADYYFLNEEPVKAILFIFTVYFYDSYPITFLFLNALKDKKNLDPRVMENPNTIICNVINENSVIYDGFYDKEIRELFLTQLCRKKVIRSKYGQFSIHFKKSDNREEYFNCNKIDNTHILTNKYINENIVVNNNLFIKIYRKIEEGIHPEIENLSALNEDACFNNVPQYMGNIKYTINNHPAKVVGLIENFISLHVRADKFFLDHFIKYHENIIELQNPIIADLPLSFFNLGKIEQKYKDLIGEFFIQMVSLLGKRTAQMHERFAEIKRENFVPEPFSILYQRSLYQTLRSLIKKVLILLQNNLNNTETKYRKTIYELLGYEKKILDFIKQIMTQKISMHRIRIHGDYYLEQILFTSKDFIITDFEGNTFKTLSERLIKRSPIKDIACMIYSFSKIIYKINDINLSEHTSKKNYYFDSWFFIISRLFFNSYMETTQNIDSLNIAKDDAQLLFKFYWLEENFIDLPDIFQNQPFLLTNILNNIKYIIDQ